jgi:hypothetical protein
MTIGCLSFRRDTLAAAALWQAARQFTTYRPNVTPVLEQDAQGTVVDLKLQLAHGQHRVRRC